MESTTIEAMRDVNPWRDGGHAASDEAHRLGVTARSSDPHSDAPPSCAFTWWLPPDDPEALSVAECRELIGLAERGIRRDDVVREPWRATAYALPVDVLCERLAERAFLPALLGNELWWRLQVDTLHAELKRYEPGHSHMEHIDLHPSTLGRKLALSVQLSDPEDYDGGDLQVRWGKWQTAPRVWGAVIAFPAWIVHRITPITNSLYLHGSCATGTDGPQSDVDLIAVSTVVHIGQSEIDRVLDIGGVADISGGRALDIMVIDDIELRANHLLRNAMRQARLLDGSTVAVPRANPVIWASQAHDFAERLIRSPGGSQRDKRNGVLWLAAARMVSTGRSSIPAGKNEIADLWADGTRGPSEWVELLRRASDGAYVSDEEARAFLYYGRSEG